jgi:hypothetical protein
MMPLANQAGPVASMSFFSGEVGVIAQAERVRENLEYVLIEQERHGWSWASAI